MNTDQRSHHSQKTALVVGANGVIGRNLIEYLATLQGWDIIGVSRRAGNPRTAYVISPPTCLIGRIRSPN